MNTKISITTQTYFGDHFYNTGWALLLSGFPVLITNWYVGIIFIVLGAILVTTVYKMVIDKKRGEIEDFLFFLGMKNNRIIKQFHRLDHISIKSGKYSQVLQLRAASTIIKGTMYSAYLITDVENFYLGESKRKKSITKKARKIAEKLNIKIIELSEEQ